VPPPKKNSPFKPRSPQPEPAPVAPKSGVPQGSTEAGWLPDFVYTGGKFEAGLAFFADAMGRLTRFSREPADLAAARRLAGQAVLPGLVNVHSVAWQRVLRGRVGTLTRGGADPQSPWRDARDAAAARLKAEDVYDTARMTFAEMLVAGITCVGEFCDLRCGAGEAGVAEPNLFARELLRAAHDVGIRLALFSAGALRSGYGQPVGSAPPRARFESADAFIRATEALRVEIERAYPADEVWLGTAPESLATVPLDDFKAIAEYAHTRRMRLQTAIGAAPDENAACTAEYGRSPVALLADRGLVDKRFTAVHGVRLNEDEVRLLGAARATVCACPTMTQDLALGVAPVDQLLAADAGIALGTGNAIQVDVLKEARLLEYSLRGTSGRRPVLGPDSAAALLHAATVTGARSLGATGGALEVGRPADFFTVNVYEPAIAGADAESLLANIVFSLERRAIREVWIGARQRIVSGRHPDQGAIVGRFVDLQRRFWAA
jgi:formimidoylglutamate deiminase